MTHGENATTPAGVNGRTIIAEIWPGVRVKCFDGRLFKDDKSTPLTVTMKEATVVRRYGYKTRVPLSFVGDWPDWTYPDLVDVVFDHRPERVSRGHFTTGVEVLHRQGLNEILRSVYFTHCDTPPHEGEPV